MSNGYTLRPVTIITATDPRLYRPQNARSIDLPASRVQVSIALGGEFDVVWSAVEQLGHGIVKQIGFVTSDWANTKLILQVNGIPFPPYDSIVGPIGTLEAPDDIEPIDLNPGDIFMARIINNAGGAITAMVRTKGWVYFPEGGR